MQSPQNIPDGFRDLSNKLWSTLEPLKTASFPTAYTYPIDCDTLPPFSIGKECINHEQLRPFFHRLAVLSHPAVYWFEITSDHTGQQLYEMMKTYRESPNRKNFPALKNTIDATSKVLYVGKTKKRTDGRMYVHLGYYPIPGTAGLQLTHWAVGIGLKLNLHIIELPLTKETEDLSALFEHRLASILRPLAGKHNI